MKPGDIVYQSFNPHTKFVVICTYKTRVWVHLEDAEDDMTYVFFHYDLRLAK